MIGIYGFQNQLNGKWYIGQSIHIEQRKKEHYYEMQSNRRSHPFYRALRKYGWENFIFHIIEECPVEKLTEREIYWIAYYNAYEKGYNATPGGQEKYYDPHLIYDAWDEGLSTSEIAKKLNIGVSCVRTNLHGYKNYSIPEAHKRGGQLARKNRQLNKNNQYKIYQYDLQGNFIKGWPSCKEIARSCGYEASVIGKCLNNHRLSAYNYQWKNFYQERIEPLKSNRGRSVPIIQCDLNGNEIQVFNSIKEASEAIHGDASLIGRAKDNLNKTAYGYKWKTLK